MEEKGRINEVKNLRLPYKIYFHHIMRCIDTYKLNKFIIKTHRMFAS